MPAKSLAPPRQEWCLPSECEDCRLLAEAPRTMTTLFKTNLSTSKSHARSPQTRSASSKASSRISVQSISTKEIDPSDDASTMSSAGASPVSRPRSSKSNHHDLTGPYCLRRPTLKEILDDTAQPPWNLAAFVDYASSNLCLENIEFVQDAAKYRQLYDSLVGGDGSLDRVNADASVASPSPAQHSQLQAQWDSIISLYIAQSSPKEVNIPGNIRNALAKVSTATVPVHPKHLEPAVAKVMELIEDSILFGFLHDQKSADLLAGDEYLSAGAISKRRSSPALEQVASGTSTSSATFRTKRPTSSIPFSNLSTSFGRSASSLKPSGARSLTTSPCDRLSVASASDDAYASYTEWTDESPSLRSPAGLISPLMSPVPLISPVTTATRKSTSTPPTTPPASDIGDDSAKSRAPKMETWKKMGKLFRKKSSHNVQRSQRGNNVGSISEE